MRDFHPDSEHAYIPLDVGRRECAVWLNWKRGLFRVWLVVSLAYVMVVGPLIWLGFRQDYLRANPTFGDLIPLTTDDLLFLAAYALVPPVTVFAAGTAVVWAVLGFKGHQA